MAAPKTTLTPEEKLQQFNALLEGNWDDVETLPEFSLWPVGTYLVRFTKGVLDREKGSVNLSAELVQVMELANPAADAGKEPAEGAPYSERFFGSFGLGKLKRYFGEISEAMGHSGIVDFIDNIGGLEFEATIGQRADKDDKTKLYNEIKALELPAA